MNPSPAAPRRRISAPAQTLLAAGLLLGGLAGCASTPSALPAHADQGVWSQVDEDDHVRIGQLRVHGEVRDITVSLKSSAAPAYLILPARGGHDPSQWPPREATGVRMWTVARF